MGTIRTIKVLSNEKTLEIFEKTRDLLKNQENWTRGQFARNRHDGPETVWSLHAVKWCVLGAMFHCTSEKDKNTSLIDSTIYSNQFREAMEKEGTCSVLHLNDVYGYEAVMRVLKTAINKLKQEP